MLQVLVEILCSFVLGGPIVAGMGPSLLVYLMIDTDLQNLI